MIIRKDSNKPILEVNDNELKIFYLFRTKVIPLNNILSLYVFNDVLYILCKNGDKYSKSLIAAKFSERGNIELLVDNINNNNLLFSNQDENIGLTVAVLSMVNCFNVASRSIILGVLLILILLIIVSIQIFHIGGFNSYFICYNTKTKEIIKYNKNNEIVYRESIFNTTKIKKSTFNGFVNVKGSKNKITLPPEVSYPKRYNIAIHELLLFSNNINNK